MHEVIAGLNRNRNLVLVETYLSTPTSRINCKGSIIDIDSRPNEMQASYARRCGRESLVASEQPIDGVGFDDGRNIAIDDNGVKRTDYEYYVAFGSGKGVASGVVQYGAREARSGVVTMCDSR